MNQLRVLGLGTLLVAGLLFITGAKSPAQAVPAQPSTAVLQTTSPYIQVEQGQLPLILSVPHGGDRRPAAIPDRQNAVLLNDPESPGYAYELAAAIEDLTGRRPYMVVNRLHRSKMDPNRSIAHGAQGDPQAEQAWRAYHAALQAAQVAAVEQCGRGHLFDLHSHGHSGRWVELGFGLPSEALQEGDEDLAKRRYVYASNLRALADQTGYELPELIRGEDSVGGLLQGAGYRVVPSPARPKPSGEYFDGGLITYLHGSRRSGAVDATQVEVSYDLLQPGQQERFVEALAAAIIDFMREHYGWSTDPESATVCSPYVDVPQDRPEYPSVAALHARGAVEPCQQAPRRFCPDQIMTRGQAALDLWRALYPTTPPPESDRALLRAADEGPGSAAMGALWRAGYIDLCGIAPLRFCADAPLTRGDLAAWTLRVQQGRFYLPARPQGRFTDAPASEWASWWLEPAYEQGLLSICSRGRPELICPGDRVTRGELARALAVALGID